METEFRKTSLIAIILLVVSTLSVSLTILPITATGVTLFVGGIGPGNYTAVQDAIDEASPGDTIFVHSGTYLENVTIDKPISLVGENKSTTVIDGSGSETTIFIDSDWVNVSELTIENELFSGVGVRLYISDSCRIANNVIKAPSTGISLFVSYHNTIIANTVNSTSSSGIYLSASWWNDITHNNVSSRTYGIYGIRLQSSNNNVIANNLVSGSSLGVYLGGAHRNIIDSNMFSDIPTEIFLDRSAYASILGDMDLKRGIGLSGEEPEHWNTHFIDTSITVKNKPVYYWKNVTGGTVPTNGGQIILANCANVVVTNQTMNNVSFPVSLGFTSSSLIVGNNLSDNGVGISFDHSSGNIIAENILFQNGQGINLESSEGNSIAFNEVTYNFVGIGVYPHSNNNTIVNNLLMNNTHRGLYLDYSENNRIYHNSFINNTEQAFDDSFWHPTRWDNGYPSGGNYWSTFYVPDEKSGPNQDQNGNDDIRDQPYYVPSTKNLQDRYPLVSPYEYMGNKPPICAMGDPTYYGFMSGTYTLTGAAYDSDGTVERVELRVDDGGWKQANGSSFWSFELDTRTLSRGRHTVQIRCFDGTDYSEEISVTVSVSNISPLDYLPCAIAVGLVIGVPMTVLIYFLRARKKDHIVRVGKEEDEEGDDEEGLDESVEEELEN